MRFVNTIATQRLVDRGKHADKPWKCAIGVAMVVGETDESPAVAVVHDAHPSESSRPDGMVTGKGKHSGEPSASISTQ